MEAADFKSTILRLPAVYGPRDEQSRLYEFLRRMDDGRPAIILPQHRAIFRWTHSYIVNVGYAIGLSVTNKQAAGRIYNVGSPEALSVAEWVREIGRAVGWRGQVVVLPNEQLPHSLRWKGAENQDLIVDSSQIRNGLGFSEIVSFGKGLASTIEWLRANHPQNAHQHFDYATEDKLLRLPGLGYIG